MNGRVAYEGDARALQADAALQSRLLGVVHQESGDAVHDVALKEQVT